MPIRALFIRRLAALLLLGLMCRHAPSAQAAVTGVSCYVTGSAFLNFGPVDLFDGNTDSTLVLSYACGASAAPSGIAYVRLCVGLGSGSGGTALSPRTLSANDGSGLTLQYNLYADAARTLVIGSSETGSPASLNINTQNTVSNYYTTTTGTITLYARIPTGQGARISSPYAYYVSTFSGTQSLLRYAWSATAAPTSCETGANTGSVDLNLQVQASIESGCFIATATDLDFGQHNGLITTNQDQTSSISIACSGTNAWQIGLSNGAHYASGNRHMASAAGGLIAYQLYRNAARSQLWGTTLGSDTVSGTGAAATQVTVYGRVPAQSALAAGTYSDVVTVTLTY